MIYKSLDTLPYKVFLKIAEDETKINLLSTDENSNDEVLKIIWNDLLKEYEELSNQKEEPRLFNMRKEISYLECKHKIIAFSLVALDFDYNQELVDLLSSYGYTVTKENYYNDLEKVDRESQGLVLKIKRIKNAMPKEKKSGQKVSIDRIFAFYSSVLGYDFDYNTVSVTKVLALQDQVNDKIKALEKNNNPKK